jgi:hypothetical protein
VDRSALMLVFACWLIPIGARADEIALGGQLLSGNEAHVEQANNASVNYPVPFAVLDARFKRIEVSGELVPLPTIPISNTTSGIHNLTLSYFDGTMRYWTGGRQPWCLGIGETLWNQQTSYLYSPTQYDASRGAGARYELGNAIPVFKHDYVETIIAASPTIHARLSYTYGSPGYASSPVSEQESQVDLQIALVEPAGRWRFKYGVRYMNMTAKFDDGSFADANHVAGVFVTGLYAFQR